MTCSTNRPLAKSIELNILLICTTSYPDETLFFFSSKGPKPILSSKCFIYKWPSLTLYYYTKKKNKRHVIRDEHNTPSLFLLFITRNNNNNNIIDYKKNDMASFGVVVLLIIICIINTRPKPGLLKIDNFVPSGFYTNKTIYKRNYNF